MPLSGGQAKHQPRLGPKGEAAHLHHHKHVYHTHYAAGGKPKEQEAEATKVHGGSAWNTEQHHYGSKSRNYADGMSVGPNGMDPMGYGYVSQWLLLLLFKSLVLVKTFFLCFYSHFC